MKVIVQNVGQIDLKKYFLAEGGEKSIYRINDTAFAIYKNKNDMIPLGKIQELSVLDDNHIIKPKNLIFDDKKNPIGYTMDFISNTYAMPLIFTNTFKRKNNIDNNLILSLIKNFKTLIDNIHKHNIVVVDLNELNFLISNNNKDIYAIDVNSYQTKNFPATVIMPSVRDYNSTSFNQYTDWFSWAIVTFQMLIGIHPYKGTYEQFNSYEIEERIKQRIINKVSVFNDKVKIPFISSPRKG
jgi:DNA-binding helix-hairpin-helix protein with protein kinase domain